MRSLFSLLACFVLGCAQAPVSFSMTRLASDNFDADARTEDIAFFCETIRTFYIYAPRSVGPWADCEATYAPRARAAETPAAFFGVLEDALAELHDHHAGLSLSTPTSPQLVPTTADLWLEWRGGQAVITAVRPDSVAAAAQLHAGMVVTAIDGTPVDDVVSRTLDAAANGYRLRVRAAGRQDKKSRLLSIQSRPEPVELAPVSPPTYEHPLSFRRIGDVGVIHIHNALGDRTLVRAFDDALEELQGTSGLIVDLRDTPSGGDTGVAEPLMARFVDHEQGYQRLYRTRNDAGRIQPEVMLSTIKPRPGKPTINIPLVILVSRWTGSMGEGIAVGLDGIRRATVVGTRMAGLAGATRSFTLPRSRIPFQFPFATIDTIRWQPRESFEPPVLVDLETATGNDPILTAGLAVLGNRETVASR